MRWLATVLLLLVGVTASAASIDESTARATATRFLQNKMDVKLRGAVSGTLHHVGTRMSAVNADVADYYVYTTEDGHAFVIVAGDDRAQEILAYGDTGLDMNRIPDAMQWMDAFFGQRADGSALGDLSMGPGHSLQQPLPQ